MREEKGIPQILVNKLTHAHYHPCNRYIPGRILIGLESRLGLVRRVHRLQIQSQLQAESAKTNIIFPQLQKHLAKEGSNLFVPAELEKTTDDAIVLAVQRAKQRAQITVKELGMADLLKTRNEWDENIPTIDCDKTDIFGDSSDDSDYEDNTDFLIPEEDTNISEVDVARDIDILSKNKLISTDLECKLNHIQQSLPRLIKVSTADSLPVYEPVSLVE